MFSLASLWLALSAAMKLRLVRWSFCIGGAALAFQTGMVTEYVCSADDPVFQQQSFLATPTFTD